MTDQSQSTSQQAVQEEGFAITIRGMHKWYGEFHVLKDINLNVTRGEKIVICGPSGSGKSTLAFDILFAEGQRRYLESLNAYARQFVQGASRPDVDSITGIPPTAGFFAKPYVILAAVQAGGPATILAVIAVLNAAIAAFYYLRVIVYLFMRDPAEPAVQVAEGPMLRAGLLIAAAGTVALGLAPTPIIEAVIQALAK